MNMQTRGFEFWSVYAHSSVFILGFEIILFQKITVSEQHHLWCMVGFLQDVIYEGGLSSGDPRYKCNHAHCSLFQWIFMA